MVLMYFIWISFSHIPDSMDSLHVVIFERECSLAGDSGELFQIGVQEYFRIRWHRSNSQRKADNSLLLFSPANSVPPGIWG